MSAVSKDERIMNLVAELLDTNRPLTRPQIVERVEGYEGDPETMRTLFERDKKVLREELGISIEQTPLTDNDVGYRIRSDEYRLPDPGLEPDELAAINLAATRIRLAGVDASSGLQKLGGLVGGRLDGDELVTLPPSPHIAAVFRAQREGRRMFFRHSGTDREVDPFRLHGQRGRWYLAGWDHARQGMRVFRLDRIDGDIDFGEPGSATTPVPDDIDERLRLSGWQAGADEPVTARVRIDAEQVPVARRMVGPDATVDDHDDGSATFTLVVRRRDGLRSFVLGFLGAAEVLDPRDLRDEIVAWLTAIEATR